VGSNPWATLSEVKKNGCMGFYLFLTKTPLKSTWMSSVSTPMKIFSDAINNYYFSNI